MMTTVETPARAERKLLRVRRAWSGWLGQIALVLAVMTVMHFWNVRHVAHGAAPSIVSSTLDGRPFSLASYRGKPALVHFWATWCGVCRAEEPTIATSSGSRVEISKALAERGLTMPVVSDPEGSLAADWGVGAFPTSFILGPDGRIRFVEVGYTSGIGLRARLWWAGL
jgi:thiol-disulfide isomerase/thioredoxin